MALGSLAATDGLSCLCFQHSILLELVNSSVAGVGILPDPLSDSWPFAPTIRMRILLNRWGF